MMELVEFFVTRYDDVLEQMLRHTALTFISVLLAVAIGIPLGILATRKARLANVVLSAVGILQTIPSIALLGFMIPLFGIGIVPAIVALMLYALLPLVRNTFTGIRGVDANVVEAARALGMTDNQILMKVELPLATPVIWAGIRTATVINVGVATLAAYIGAGGLGEFIFGGIALNNTDMILGGAIPAAVLAVALDFMLGRIQTAAARSPRAHTSNWQQFLTWVNARSLRRAFVLASSALLAVVLTVFLAALLTPPSSDDTGLFGDSGLFGDVDNGDSHDELRAGFTQEFMGRRDGYVGLKEVYGLDLPVDVMSDVIMYKAVASNDVDVISGYTTDGRIASYDLVALTDDKHIFPPYHAAPLVRQQTLTDHHELRNVLDMLAGQISDSAMIALNYQVDYQKQSPEDVARKFLLGKGLLKGLSSQSKREPTGTIVLGSKVFTEQYILVEMYRLLIEEYTTLEVDLKTGLGGTQICFGALTNGAIDMYPEYTGTGLLVMLKADAKLLDSLTSVTTTSKTTKTATTDNKVLDYVRREFRRQYNTEWLEPLGFNNAYALMMRRKQATELKIVSISDLVRHLTASSSE